MHVLSGVLLEGCFVLGLLLVVASIIVLLLRHSMWRFVKLQGAVTNSEVIPDAGFGQREQLKRPAFLPGIEYSSLRRR
jgi:hypothetical protein